MSVTFEVADSTTCKLLEQVLKRTHKPLTEAKLEVDVGFACGDDGAPAVKVAGYERPGKVTFLSTQARKHGSPDARITLDKTAWENMKGGEREALIDHLLEQVQVRTDAKDVIIRDTAGRPKLKRRKFDMMLQGFSRVLKEHQKDAIEAKQGAELNEKFGQLMLWGNGQGHG